MRPRNKKRRGFTLLELMVVMFILVMLAGVVTLVVVKRMEEARHAKAVADIDTLESAIATFYLHNKKYPENLDMLYNAPPAQDYPNWDGPYIKKPVPLDPWDRPYVYKVPGDHNKDSYDLYTLGRDGNEGGEKSDADVTNWQDSGAL